MDPAFTELRAAVGALYSCRSSDQRHAADAWLRSFVGRDGSWQQLAALLATPDATPDERYFAATSLRPLCQKQKGMTEPEPSAQLAQLLAAQLAASAAGGCWHTGNQLAAALATLAARTPAWPVGEVVPQLLSLAQGTLRAAGAGEEAQRLALLRLLGALAECAASKEPSMHPQRRAELHAALLAAQQPLAAVQEALAPAASSSLAVQVAALQMLQAWCGLGAPPAGSENQPELWRVLHSAVLLPGLGSSAAESVAALYASCCTAPDDTSGGGKQALVGSSGGSLSREHVQRQRQLLQFLLGLLPGFAAELERALAQAQGQGSTQLQAQLLFAALSVLGPAAKAADSVHWGAGAGGAAIGAAASGGAAAVQAVHLGAEVALAALQHPAFEVTLAALQHFDEQVERWGQHQAAEQQQQQQQHAQHPSPHHGACTPQQRHALLHRLCGRLLQRLELPASLPAACTTADARDLPDSAQLVRREVGDTFRAASDCLGPQQTRQQLLQLAADARASWQAGGGGSTPSWQQYECCLYVLNLVWGRHRSQLLPADAEEEVRLAADLAASALHPGAPKLAGTALTLLGGMSEQLAALVPDEQRQVGQAAQQQAEQQLGQRPDSPMACLLRTLLQLVQQGADDKLNRNAATCCHRLAGSRQLAASLAADHAWWADALCQCFAAMGGMAQRAKQGDDLCTPQFLLATVCRLAAAAAPGGDKHQDVQGLRNGGNSSSGSTQLLQRLLSQPAGAAQAALSAAALAPPGSEAQRQQVEQAAVQVETIAVALEALGGGAPGAGPMPAQLPALLGPLMGVLRQAASLAAAGAQQAASVPKQHLQQIQALLQAVCKVAAATADSPAAGMGLQLLRSLVAAPTHPAVLITLSRFVQAVGSGGMAGADGGLEELPAAVASSLQAAAAQHSADPDWQPAILQLGQACLQRLPAVAADDATLAALLRCADHSMQSYHRDVCEQALEFAEALLCMGCQVSNGAVTTTTSGAHAGDLGTAQHAAHAAHAAQEDAAAVGRLMQQLDSGGLGSGLVLGLLLAAAGNMPSYMMVLIADGLFRCWRAAGDGRFGAWLRDAALCRAPEGAPWRAWKPEAQGTAVADLLSVQCSQDARRFKRLLKVFCGGKKKGQHAEQPARGK